MSTPSNKDLLKSLRAASKNPTKETLDKADHVSRAALRNANAGLNKVMNDFKQQADSLGQVVDAFMGIDTEGNDEEEDLIVQEAMAREKLTPIKTAQPRAAGGRTPPSKAPTPPQEPIGPPPSLSDVDELKAVLAGIDRQEKARLEDLQWEELNAQAEAEFLAEQEEARLLDLQWEELNAQAEDALNAEDEFDESQLANFSFDEDEIEREYAELKAQLEREASQDKFLAQDPPKTTVQEQERVTPSSSAAAAQQPPIARHSPTTEEAAPAPAPSSTATSTATATASPPPASKGFWGNLGQTIIAGLQKLGASLQKLAKAVFGNTEKQTPGPAASTHQEKASQAKAGSTGDSTRSIITAQIHAAGNVIDGVHAIKQIQKDFLERQSKRVTASTERPTNGAMASTQGQIVHKAIMNEAKAAIDNSDLTATSLAPLASQHEENDDGTSPSSYHR